MKILAIIITLCSTFLSAQNLDYKNLKTFVGNRVNEFEDFYKIGNGKIEDNFGNLEITYQNVLIDNKTFTIVLNTDDKNINKITIINSEQRTKYFTEAATDLENASEYRKNYKTIFVSINNKSNKKKLFFEKINELLDAIRNKKYDLSAYFGEIDAYPLKANLTINSERTELIIKK